MSGRAGSTGHQNLIRYASQKLLNEVIGEVYLGVTLIREQPLDIRASVNITGIGRFADTRITDTTQRMYADIACSAVFDQGAKRYGNVEVDEDTLATLKRLKDEGKLDKYKELVRLAYGQVTYIIECETNPRSNLLRKGPRLTAYQLIKEKTPNFVLILAVFEGTKVDNPKVFDEVWFFPKKGGKVN